MFELAEQIRLLRRARGLTQEQLAERSNLSSATIQRVETGRMSPSITTLQCLAQGLDVSAAAFLLAGEGIEGAMRDVLVVLGNRERGRELLSLLARRSDAELDAIAQIIRVAFERPCE